MSKLIHAKYMLMKTKDKQQGVSILMALTLVLIIASIIAGVTLTTQYSIRRTTMITHLTQAQAYTEGALVYAKRLLLIDSYQAKHDAFDDQWAKRFPAFPVPGGQVLGHVNEISSRYNLANITLADEFEIQVFKRLFQSLGGSLSQAGKIIRQVKEKQYASTIGLFTAAGIDETMLSTMIEHFIFLPNNAEKINLNLVSAEVLAAYLSVPINRADEIIQKVRQKPITSSDELKIFSQKNNIIQIKTDPLNNKTPSVIELRFGVSSRYFQVVAQAVVGDTNATRVTTLDRGGKKIRQISTRFSKFLNE